MTTQKQRDRETAIATLREDLRPGDTVHTVLRHVTSSGMTRWIDCYYIDHRAPIVAGRELQYISWYVGHAVDSPVNGAHDGVKRGGCGMDMGFDLVYSLARTLWPDGYGCTGAGCPANDHVNGDRDYTRHTKRRPHWHRDGGYALRQRWI